MDNQEIDEGTVPSEETTEENELLNKNRQLFERAKKAEAKVKELEDLPAQSEDDDVFLEDEPQDKKVEDLDKRLNDIEETRQLDKVYSEYPVLKDKLEEFDTYREENPGMPLATAAKAFLVDKDLYGEVEKPIGLEPASGGMKTPPSSGKMSADEVKNLRENNYLEYKKLVEEGGIEIAD